jgi:molybdate transport system regulatory protein
MKRSLSELAPRLRVYRSERQFFGPGKAELLHYIETTGSIRVAAQEIGMSYQRAWNLVQEMNGLFVEPLVEMARGGGNGGGALLTATGQKVLSLYTQMEKACRTATRRQWTVMRKLLK